MQQRFLYKIGVLLKTIEKFMIIKINKKNIYRINSLLENIKENITLEFEKDVYHFYKEDSKNIEIHFSNIDSVNNPIKKIYFNIENLFNCNIEGNGSMFVFHGDICTFLINNSNKIKFTNLYIDYYVPTTVEMYVSNIDIKEKYIDYFISDIYKYTISGNDVLWICDSVKENICYWSEKNSFNAHSITLFNLRENFSKRYILSEGPFSNIFRIKKIKNGIRIFYNKMPKQIKEDCMIALNASNNRDNAGFAIVESKDVLFENVEFNYLHGFGLLVQMSENIYFNNCKFVGNNLHKVSSFADSIHVSGLKGEIEIKNSIFDSSLDDSINIHGTYLQIEKIDSKKALLRYVHHQQGGFKQFFQGNKVEFFDRNTITKYEDKEYTVKNVLHPGEYNDNLQLMEVEFEEELPKYLEKKINNEGRFVAENITYTPKVLIKNCKFKNVPSRGILCTTRKKAIIENNEFINLTMASIYLSNDANEWYESGSIKDMKIINNIFNYSNGFLLENDTKAIWIDPILNSESDLFVHENITIQNNTFYLKESKSVLYKNTDNILIKNNKFVQK